MLTAIHFYNQLLLGTDEIDLVRTDGMLATEFRATHLTIAQMSPQECFGIRHVLSEFPGTALCHGIHPSS
jgi:hypothetical protein